MRSSHVQLDVLNAMLKANPFTQWPQLTARYENPDENANKLRLVIESEPKYAVEYWLVNQDDDEPLIGFNDYGNARNAQRIAQMIDCSHGYPRH